MLVKRIGGMASIPDEFWLFDGGMDNALIKILHVWMYPVEKIQQGRSSKREKDKHPL